MGLWMTFENKTLFFQQGQWLQEFDNTTFSTSVNVLFYSPIMNRGKSVDHEQPPPHQSESKEAVSSHITPFRMVRSHFRYRNIVSPLGWVPYFEWETTLWAEAEAADGKGGPGCLLRPTMVQCLCYTLMKGCWSHTEYLSAHIKKLHI